VHVATAYLVFVGVESSGAPRAIPPVLPQSDDDERRFREAVIRREHRLAQRAAILVSRGGQPA
jgi:acyl-CoA hydrolase